MTKPVISSFNTIAPILIQQYERYLPSAFDDGMTMLEKVNKVIEYLNQIGELNNSVVEQWNSVMEWILSDGLTESVNQKLNEMATDGTLEQIINVDMIGVLGNLDTTYKNDLVGAINENVGYLSQLSLNVKTLGAKGDGVTDDTSALQSAFNLAKSTKRQLFFPTGTYMISDTLSYLTSDLLTSAFTKNGIKIYGDYGAVIKATSAFPTGKSMIELNGNENNNQEPSSAVAQIGNHMQGLIFDGNNYAQIGLKIRANIDCSYEDIRFQNISGNATTSAIYVDGVTTSNKDDADSSIGILFKNVSVYKCNGHGVLANKNRIGNFTFDTCKFRECNFDGLRISFADLLLNNCSFVSNGNVNDNTTGGLSVVKSVTQALNRGLTINGCIFESNWWHDINLEYCTAVVINNPVITPYEKSGITSANPQSCYKIGKELAENVTIIGSYFSPYALTYGYKIKGFDIYEGCKNIKIENPYFPSIIAWESENKYVISDLARNVSINNNSSGFYMFSQLGSDMVDVLGLTTNIISVSDLSLGKQYDYANEVDGNGVFIAKTDGLYDFRCYFKLKGFTINHEYVVCNLRLTKNGQSPVSLNMIRKKPDFNDQTTPVILNLTHQIYLNEGDSIYPDIQVIGTEQSVDLMQTNQTDVLWIGNKRS